MQMFMFIPRRPMTEYLTQARETPCAHNSGARCPRKWGTVVDRTYGQLSTAAAPIQNWLSHGRASVAVSSSTLTAEQPAPKEPNGTRCLPDQSCMLDPRIETPSALKFTATVYLHTPVSLSRSGFITAEAVGSRSIEFDLLLPEPEHDHTSFATTEG